MRKPGEKIAVGYLAPIVEEMLSGKGRVAAAAPAANPNAGTIVCEACGTRTRSFTGRKCDPCWRGVVNPARAAA
jgi:hypothetical protein